jgi:sulfur relay (sulfurtransferase) DsrC/TusE family protein
MPNDSPTLDVALALARRLSPADQARLIAQLAPAVAQSLAKKTSPAITHQDSWAIIEQLRRDFYAQGPVSPSITETLLSARR